LCFDVLLTSPFIWTFKKSQQAVEYEEFCSVQSREHRHLLCKGIAEEGCGALGPVLKSYHNQQLPSTFADIIPLLPIEREAEQQNGEKRASSCHIL
jgi:hypothetical protein